MAQPFDISRLRTHGEAVPAADHAAYIEERYFSKFTVSSNGTVIYEQRSGNENDLQLTWFDRAGKIVGSIGEPAHFDGIRISPDGSQIVAAIRNHEIGCANLWLYDISRGVKTRLTSEEHGHQTPVWSPDSRRVAYQMFDKEKYCLVTIPTDGSGRPDRLYESEKYIRLTDWSLDGKNLLYASSTPKCNP